MRAQGSFWTDSFNIVYRSEVRQNKEVTAKLLFVFGTNWNSLDYGAPKQVDPNRVAGQFKEIR